MCVMYVYISVYIHAYVSMCVYKHLFIYIYVCVDVCMCTYVYAFLCIVYASIYGESSEPARPSGVATTSACESDA